MRTKARERLSTGGSSLVAAVKKASNNPIEGAIMVAEIKSDESK
jgi:hypothetical protein